MADAGWEQARRVLCLRLDSLGDVLMTGPALRALAQAHPGRELTLLASPSGAAAGRLLPGVHDVLVYEAPWMKHTPVRASPAYDGAMVARLRGGGYDAAVIFTVFSQDPLPAALLCYLAGIPLRAAYCRPHPYQLLTDWLPEQDPAADGSIRHEVRRQLDLAAALGAISSDERLAVDLPPGAREDALQVAKARGLDPAHPWIVAHTGATAPSRRYPPALFAQAIAGLHALGLQVVLTGDSGERSAVRDIVAASGGRAVCLAGELTLEQMAGLLADSSLLLSNNSGPVHLAAAVGTPVVDLYALTNPQHTPWGVPDRVLSHDVPCRDCFKSVCPEGHHACLAQIAPDEVVSAVASLLGETRRAPRSASTGGQAARRR